MYSIRKPYEDELFTTWLEDMVELNGLTWKEFCEEVCHERTYKGHPMYPRSIEDLCRGQVDMALFPDVKTILVCHTNLYQSLLFMESGLAARCLEYVLRSADMRYGTGFHIDLRQNSYGMEYHYCPVCIEEDKARYGKIITHVSHQFKGVKTCWKHGCVLINKFGYELAVKDIGIEKRISAYARALYEKPIFSHMEQTKEVIKHELLHRGIDFTKAASDAEKVGYLDADMTVVKEYRDSVRSYNRFLIRMVAYLFELDEFQQKIKKYEPNVLDNSDLRIVWTDGILAQYECKYCGMKFYRHIKGNEIGLPCIRCGSNRSLDEQMHLYLQRFGDYDFVDGTNYKKIRHNPCGCEKQNPKSFMFYATAPCSACKRRDVARWQQVFEDTEYVVKDVEFKKKMSSNVILRHIVCGTEFKIKEHSGYFKKKINWVHCPVCEPFHIKLSEVRQQRIGLYKIDAYGVGMTIIDYKNANKMLVRFDSGIKCWMTWNAFSSGAIRQKGAHIGECVRNKDGVECKIMEYVNQTNVLVECGDKRVRCTYKKFRDGNVR